MRGACRAAGLLVACGGGGGDHLVPASSSILLVDDTLWVASPDEEALVGLHPDTLEETVRIEVLGRPSHLAWDGAALLISGDRAQALTRVDPTTGGVERLDVPCGGTGPLVARDGRAWVSCPYDGRLLELVDFELIRTLALGGAPTSLAIVDGTLSVGDSRWGSLRHFSLEALEALPETGWAVQPAPTSEDESLSDERAAIGLFGLTPVLGESTPVALYQRVDHDDRDRPPELGSYGAVVDEDPRIEPRLAGPCGDRYAVFDGGGAVFSGPTALAEAGGHLWIAHRATRNVAVIDCATGELEAHFAVGAGARGLALSADGRQAWVDLSYDHAVAELILPSSPSTTILQPERTVRREAAVVGWSEAAQVGRRVFHDATDTHLTPSGVVSCGTCHPDGGADHLVWFFHTEEIPAKVRRTPPTWGADPAARPLHWDGEFTDASALVKATTTGLMGGDALLVDTAAVAAFMAEAEPPVPRPLDPEEAELAELGALVFTDAGCGDCHLDSDGTDGQLHEVLATSDDPEADLAFAVTPALVALRARAPYLHDGRAGSIEAVFTQHNPADLHGRTSGLSPDELDQLLAYLRSL